VECWIIHHKSLSNTISERDFAKLDRLLREKPDATTLALEGLIMFSRLVGGFKTRALKFCLPQHARYHKSLKLCTRQEEKSCRKLSQSLACSSAKASGRRYNGVWVVAN